MVLISLDFWTANSNWGCAESGIKASGPMKSLPKSWLHLAWPLDCVWAYAASTNSTPRIFLNWYGPSWRWLNYMNYCFGIRRKRTINSPKVSLLSIHIWGKQITPIVFIGACGLGPCCNLAENVLGWQIVWKSVLVCWNRVSLQWLDHNDVKV